MLLNLICPYSKIVIISKYNQKMNAMKTFFQKIQKQIARKLN